MSPLEDHSLSDKLIGEKDTVVASSLYDINMNLWFSTFRYPVLGLGLPAELTRDSWLDIAILYHINLIQGICSYLALDAFDKNSGLSEVLLEKIII